VAGALRGEEEKLTGRAMDDGDFKERLRKLYDDHARVISLIESMPPPTEAQKKEVQGLIVAQKRE
jgi:hypothetical protein